MKFADTHKCFEFFKLMQIENTRRSNIEDSWLKLYSVLIRNMPALVLTGIGGDYFIFTQVDPMSKPNEYMLDIDGAVYDHGDADPLPTQIAKILTKAVESGWIPVELLTCIAEYRQSVDIPVTPMQDDYSIEIVHALKMLDLLEV